MPFQYINKMLNMPELQVSRVQQGTNPEEVYIEVIPTATSKVAPFAVQTTTSSEKEEIRRARSAIFPPSKNSVPLGSQHSYVLLLVRCGFCLGLRFVEPKKRYSKRFREMSVQQALGSTATHSARMLQAPVSTVQRMHNEAIPTECERLYKLAWDQAATCNNLVLGVDDFAIKKGHTYNTGIHDLKGGMLLDILPGRKLDELVYVGQCPAFLELWPKAVVMDLARGYHTQMRFGSRIDFMFMDMSLKPCKRSISR